MYYGATELFKTQTVLDKIVEDLSKLVKVPRDAFNLVATGKGLVFGAIRINNVDTIDVRLIPAIEEISSLQCEGRFVLVVEKDAVMNAIVQYYNQMTSFLGPFVLITGKGYPCLKTKHFLNMLETTFPHLPIYCLVDHDPFGIHICLTYASKSPVSPLYITSNSTSKHACSMKMIAVRHCNTLA